LGVGPALPLVADMSIAGNEKITKNKYPDIDILVNNRVLMHSTISFPQAMRIGGGCLR
jgi:hypothetical protein